MAVHTVSAWCDGCQQLKFSTMERRSHRCLELKTKRVAVFHWYVRHELESEQETCEHVLLNPWQSMQQCGCSCTKALMMLFYVMEGRLKGSRPRI